MARYRLLWLTLAGLLTVGGVVLDLRYVDIDLTVGISVMAAAAAGSIYFNLEWPRRRPGQRLAIPTILVGAVFAAIAVALCGYWVGLEAVH